ncbi:MAG TPA: acyl carrier protein [Verrucomicrobiae bacterium]|nr:acyl carrier protein [Verrucomicrobiae bacterium]
MIVETDRLRDLLVEFFELAPETALGDIVQERIAEWDSLAMVQLIVEIQNVFGVGFDVEEIEQLASYSQIRQALNRKGVKVSQ